MNDNTVVIREFNEQFEALMYADQLKSAGIDCFLSNDNLNNINPMIMVIPTAVYLHVFEKDLEQANAILQDMDNMKPTSLDEDFEITHD